MLEIPDLMNEFSENEYKIILLQPIKVLLVVLEFEPRASMCLLGGVLPLEAKGFWNYYTELILNVLHF
jgi:hypothetical protein